VNTTYTFTVPITTASIQKLVIDISGNGDGNTSLFIDDITYASSYNYTGSYDCKAKPIATPLPIKLVSFVGTINNNKVQLSWTADDNETGSSFEVEKSNGDNKFKSIAFISTTDKVGIENYSYNDAAEVNGYNNYRLKIVNKDNSIAYSKIIAFKAKGTTNDKITLLQNPVTSSLSFSYTATQNEVLEVTIYNIAGSKLQGQKLQMTNKQHVLTVFVDGTIPRGQYILSVQSSTGNQSAKFIKQ
jgi:hypothetical protein